MHQPLNHTLLQHPLQTHRHLHDHMYQQTYPVLTGYDLALQGDQNQLLSNRLLNYLHYQGTEPHYTIDDDLFSLGMAATAITINA